MERLAARTHDGHAYLANVKDDEQGVECRSRNTAQCIMDSWERLAAYEDTGLEPEEIPHWISVSERLPEPEANVLIWQSYRGDAPYSNITIGHLHQESDLRIKPYWTWIAYGADMVHPKIEAWHRADFICPGNEFVTHWMPLPQPPQKG